MSMVLKFEGSTCLSYFSDVRITSTWTSSVVSLHLLTAEKTSKSQMVDPSNQSVPIASRGGKKPAYEKEPLITLSKSVVKSKSFHSPVRTSASPTLTKR